jgi:hypothetical protein
MTVCRQNPYRRRLGLARWRLAAMWRAWKKRSSDCLSERPDVWGRSVKQQDFRKTCCLMRTAQSNETAGDEVTMGGAMGSRGAPPFGAKINVCARTVRTNPACRAKSPGRTGKTISQSRGKAPSRGSRLRAQDAQDDPFATDARTPASRLLENSVVLHGVRPGVGWFQFVRPGEMAVFRRSRRFLLYCGYGACRPTVRADCGLLAERAFRFPHA